MTAWAIPLLLGPLLLERATLGTPQRDLLEAAAEPSPAPSPGRGRLPPVFVELQNRVTSLDGAFAVTLGGTANVMVAGRVIVGLGGYGMVYHGRTYRTLVGDLSLEFGYGGPSIGVVVARTKRLEASANLLIAGGRACLYDGDDRIGCRVDQGVFVTTLDFSSHVRLGRVARLGIVLGYRLAVSREPVADIGAHGLGGGYGGLVLSLGRLQSPTIGSPIGGNTAALHSSSGSVRPSPR